MGEIWNPEFLLELKGFWIPALVRQADLTGMLEQVQPGSWNKSSREAGTSPAGMLEQVQPGCWNKSSRDDELRHSFQGGKDREKNYDSFTN